METTGYNLNNLINYSFQKETKSVYKVVKVNWFNKIFYGLNKDKIYIDRYGENYLISEFDDLKIKEGFVYFKSKIIFQFPNHIFIYKYFDNDKEAEKYLANFIYHFNNKKNEFFTF